jgi:DNA helicase-2/ATP-dependent DNA helicase PcrA
MSDFNIEEELNEGLLKELEKDREEAKLEDTINLINKEMLKYVEKRKSMSDYILDYRKNVIEEYKDDEDKIIEYFDHEKFVKEEAFRTIDRRLREMVILAKVPYFGRVDFKEEDNEIPENIYIGRFGMTPEGAYEPVIVDWRAPISAMFYNGKLGKMNYKAPGGDIETDILHKRQFIIKKAKLLGMFDSAVDVKDEILQMVLSANSSEKLKDIIMTIQEEQDNLIRQPRNKTIVVNGVAGSGKTTIALHRVAYLLYNYRESLQDKVLILGPNNIFMEYISTVLPSLGEVGVKQRTFNDYAMDILGIHVIVPFKDYIEKVFSKDETLINEIKYKHSDKFLEYLDSEIDKIEKYHFVSRDISFRDKVIVSKSDIEDMLNVHYKNMLLFRRTKRIRRVIFGKLRDARDEVYREIQKNYEESLSKLSPGELQTHRNNIEFDRRLKIRELIRDVLNVKSELQWISNPDMMILYSAINGDKPLTSEDLAPLLYLKLKLDGIKLNDEVKHVVIDEAQDYSALQFKVIRELTKCISMTIVGDSNQRILPLEGEVPMLKLKDTIGDLDVENYSLDKSYRSTREIMEHANNFLVDSKIMPLVRSGEPVVKQNFKNSEELTKYLHEILESMSRKGYESIAIVCRDLNRVKSLAQKLKELTYIKIVDREELIYTGGTVLIPSYYAKGLEFDAVIVVDDASIADKEEHEDKVKYVMCTRALHELYDITQE